MEAKECRKCKITKPLTDYSKWPNRNSLRPDCKACVNETQKQYRKDNPNYYQNVLKRGKDKRDKEREIVLKTLQDDIENKKKCTTCGYVGPRKDFVKPNQGKALSRIRLRGTCKKCNNIKQKQWRDKNPEKLKAINKKTYDRRRKDPEYRELKKQNDRDRYQDPEVKQRVYEWQRNFRKTSPIHRWRQLLKNTLARLNQSKITNTEKMLGFNATQLIEHIGEKPKGRYAIDHKLPLSWLIETTPANIACNLNNLQWLQHNENTKKNNHYADPIPLAFYQEIKPYIKGEYQDRFAEINNEIIDLKKAYILYRWANNLSSIE
jgi:hypothetical protein